MPDKTAARRRRKEAYDMGYDMRWVKRSPNEREAVAEAMRLFTAACNARDLLPREERGWYSADEWAAIRAGKLYDEIPGNATPRYREAQEAVMAASRAVDKADASYFRLNISGMGRVREAMARLGVLYDGYSQDAMPDWPELPEEYWDVERSERASRFPAEHAASVAMLSWSPRENGEGGIPVHKLGSNDGWIVTPEECFVAASAIRATATDIVLKTLVACGVDNEGWLETWNDWVQWLADASEHGGFEVH